MSSYVAGFVTLLLFTTLAAVMDIISSRVAASAYIVLCIAATIVLSHYLRNKPAPASSSDKLPIEPLDAESRDKALRVVKNLKIGIGITLLIFAYALWNTRSAPLLPRITGTAVDLLVIGTLIAALRRKKEKLTK